MGYIHRQLRNNLHLQPPFNLITGWQAPSGYHDAESLIYSTDVKRIDYALEVDDRPPLFKMQALS